MEKGWGAGYGHEFKLVTKQELVRWLGVPIHHGARDGSTSGLHRRWMRDNVDFEQQIKSIFKLNNNLTMPKRGDVGYDPAAKYNLIYCTMCHDMNHVTLRVELDVAADESTWGFMRFMGDAGGRLMNKPVGEGGQISADITITEPHLPQTIIHVITLFKPSLPMQITIFKCTNDTNLDESTNLQLPPPHLSMAMTSLANSTTKTWSSSHSKLTPLPNLVQCSNPS